MPNWKILDCTLRDGGYYTGWDFSRELVARYLKAVAAFPVEFVELGYRSELNEGYLGAYYYLPRSILEWARGIIPDGPRFALMLNAKECRVGRVGPLLADCRDLVQLVRFAADPTKLDETLIHCEEVKAAGFEVALNLMYLSKDHDLEKVFGQIARKSELVDHVALVDSFGACYPTRVGEAVRLAKSILPMPVGFHGHDNISLAFANALAAIEAGADMIDSTITGMGRGAGNLRTELISGYHARVHGLATDYRGSTQCLDEFNGMKARYGWGPELPYVVAGLNNLPQAQVMDWLAQDRYSTTAIVGALQRAQTPAAHGRLATKEVGPDMTNASACLIVGGGPSVTAHAEALVAAANGLGLSVVYTGCRHVASLPGLRTERFVCLVGDEYARGEDQLLEQLPGVRSIWIDADGYVAVPQDPGVLAKLAHAGSLIPVDGVPDAVLGNASPFGVALAGALRCGFRRIYLTGFDGYVDATKKAAYLTAETQGLLARMARDHADAEVVSVTSTRYDVKQTSVYSLLSQIGVRDEGHP
jgi:4-hydroxy 2-oxovalerate aldolase